MEIPHYQKDNFEIWRNDPMTTWYLQQIDLERQEVQDQMGLGNTVDCASIEVTALQTAKNFGKISGLYFCTEFEIERGEE